MSQLMQLKVAWFGLVWFRVTSLYLLLAGPDRCYQCKIQTCEKLHFLFQAGYSAVSLGQKMFLVKKKENYKLVSHSRPYVCVTLLHLHMKMSFDCVQLLRFYTSTYFYDLFTPDIL